MLLLSRGYTALSYNNKLLIAQLETEQINELSMSLWPKVSVGKLRHQSVRHFVCLFLLSDANPS